MSSVLTVDVSATAEDQAPTEQRPVGSPGAGSAIVCGTGPDGLALAIALGRAGWQVRIIGDEAPNACHGYLVELDVEALSALQQLSVAEQIREVSEPVTRVRWVDARGRAIVGLSDDDDDEGAAEPLYVPHDALEDILLGSLPPTVEVQWRTSLCSVELQSDGVAVTLSSGEHLRADFLIGADGGHSRVRELVFGNEGLWQESLGHHSAAFIFKDATIHHELAGELTVASAPGRLLALRPLRGSRVAATLAFRAERDVKPTSPAGWLKFVFGDLEWFAPSVLEHAQAVKRLHYDRATEIKACTWQRQRAALLGDACHAYSVLPGFGCASKIASAVYLGNDLARGAAFEAAFMRYEARLMREIQVRRRMIRRMANWLLPASRAKWIVRNGLLRAASVTGLQSLIGAGDASRQHLMLRDM